MPANYVLLEKITVGAAGASSVTFSGIPQTGYTDLVMKVSARGTDAAARVVPYVQFNGSTTSYSAIRVFGQDSSSTGSVANEGGTNAIHSNRMPAAGSTASTFGNMEFYIPNYTSTNYKSSSSESVTENNSSTNWNVSMVAGLWSNTAAITSITLTPDAGNFAANSTFYLYGVAALGTTPAIVPYATGGDTIMTDGTYWYHTFISSGTFTPAKAITCDYMVVAGGGSGGVTVGGGGGAGGLRSTVTATGGGGSLETALSLASGTGYTVTVGAGGASNASGSNSVFSSITSTGGGYGPSNNANGISGGSGSGGGGSGGGPFTGGAGTANQGRAGGSSAITTGDPAGGGGGAGAVGGNGFASNGGAGGAGVATSITGSSVTYAGGGGGGVVTGTGGSGGSGGGGAGSSTGAGSAGTANTGGGAGGSDDTSSVSSPGGSGIVVVRYAV